jgi:hypothetical protein
MVVGDPKAGHRSAADAKPWTPTRTTVALGAGPLRREVLAQRGRLSL